MNKIISIIVPVFNIEKYIGRCINSIIIQSYTNLEIILIDDGSSDSCGNLCDIYALLDNRIKVIHKMNSGLSDTRNFGLEIASGEYISFIDGDDYISPVCIETLYKMCEENEAQIAQCGFTYVNETQSVKTDKTIKSFNVILYTPLNMLNNLYNELCTDTVVVWNKLYKKELFDGIRFPKGRIHEDVATTYRLIYSAKKIAVTKESLYYYCMSENSIMRCIYNPQRLDIVPAYIERLEFFELIHNVGLYNKTLYQYLYILVRQYYLSRKYCNDLKDIQNEIWAKIKSTYYELKQRKGLSTKSKLKMKILRYMPNIYGKVYIKK